MAFTFKPQQKATAVITRVVSGEQKTQKFAGVNGKQTDAGNYYRSMIALLALVGQNTTLYNAARQITQDVEED